MSIGYILQLKSEAGADGAFAAAYAALKDSSLADALWFGWNELDIRLPRRLTDEADALDPRWDVARIFTPAAELRAQRVGRTRLVLLLTESAALVEQLKQQFGGEAAKFRAQVSHRVLAGQRPRQPIGANPDALIEVQFPRPLDYQDLTAQRGTALVADVQCYYDSVYRLRDVRYCSITAEPIGQREVKPL
jgi:hypothetical protein